MITERPAVACHPALGVPTRLAPVSARSPHETHQLSAEKCLTHTHPEGNVSICARCFHDRKRVLPVPFCGHWLSAIQAANYIAFLCHLPPTGRRCTTGTTFSRLSLLFCAE